MAADSHGQKRTSSLGRNTQFNSLEWIMRRWKGTCI
jgi:hypothetical protein